MQSTGLAQVSGLRRPGKQRAPRPGSAAGHRGDLKGIPGPGPEGRGRAGPHMVPGVDEQVLVTGTVLQAEGSRTLRGGGRGTPRGDIQVVGLWDFRPEAPGVIQGRAVEGCAQAGCVKGLEMALGGSSPRPQSAGGCCLGGPGCAGHWKCPPSAGIAVRFSCGERSFRHRTSLLQALRCARGRGRAYRWPNLDLFPPCSEGGCGTWGISFPAEGTRFSPC